MPRVPLPWLAEFVELPPGAATTAEGAEQVAADLARLGLEEEGREGGTVSGPLVVGRVLSVTPEKQKNGKTVNWCTVDVGEHDAEGAVAPRGIVCGAHNFAPGDKVVVALPGTVLPGPFEISARKTYGHVSDGMICSERELGMGEDHDGIIVLSRKGLDAPVGADAIGLLGLDEQTLEINVTPDRGYCFSMRGVAREYSHATGAPFHDPADLPVDPPAPGGFPVVLADGAPIRGRAGCDRFVARIVRDVDATRPSPLWMRRRLTQAGMRPLGLAVDVTNYVMLELGQPLHAYDADLLAAPVVVRRAHAGENLMTLDGITRRLDVEDLLITDSPTARAGASPAGSAVPGAVLTGARILGLAGVMGGELTGVSPTTRTILVEAAHFDPVTVARTARRHKLPSEAARRFERGVDPALCAAAAQRVVDLLVEYGGGRADGPVTDVDERIEIEAITFDPELPARHVGVDYTLEEVRDILERIGCRILAAADAAVPTWRVHPPSWRIDLKAPVDLVEEVARVAGYDRIPSVLPQAPSGRGPTASQRARRSVARALSESGFTEVLSYPFVSPRLFDAFGYDADDARRRAVELSNPLSEEAPLLRTSVLDTLVDAVRRNLSRGMSDLALYEIGLVFRPGAVQGPAGMPGVAHAPSAEELARLEAAIPDQPRHVAGMLTGRREPAGVWGPGRDADWSDAVQAVRVVAARLRLRLEVARAECAPWHPGRCAAFALGDGTVVGHAGELHPKVCETLLLPARTVAFEADLDAMIDAGLGPIPGRSISTYPAAKEDIALVVPAEVPAVEVLTAVREGAGDMAEDVALFDVYTGEQVPEGHKSLAFSLRLRAADRTLRPTDVLTVREAAIAEAGRRFGAVLRA